MDWKKERGPWDFKKSAADRRYNEGTLIAHMKNPVWKIPNPIGTPITNYHTPCGYWLKDYVGPDLYTSDLYPLEDVGNIDSSGATIIEGRILRMPKDFGYIDSSGPSIIAGNLIKDFFLVEYKEWPVEEIDSSGATITSGLLAEDFILVEYDIDHEDIDSSGATIQSGNLEDVLIKYTDWPVESVNSSEATIIGGNLE